jgi:hypothetical protein
MEPVEQHARLERVGCHGARVFEPLERLGRQLRRLGGAPREHQQLGMVRLLRQLALDVLHPVARAVVTDQHADAQRQHVVVARMRSGQLVEHPHALGGLAGLERHLRVPALELELVGHEPRQRARLDQRILGPLEPREHADLLAVRRHVVGMELEVMGVGQARVLEAAEVLVDEALHEQQARAHGIEIGRERERRVCGAEASEPRLGGRELEPRLAVRVVEPHGTPVAAGSEPHVVAPVGDRAQRAQELDAVGVRVHRRRERGKRLVLAVEAHQRGALQPQRLAVARVHRERLARELERAFPVAARRRHFARAPRDRGAVAVE